MPVKYFGGDVEVKEGDVVKYKSILRFWKKNTGRVSYVPGISKFNSEMENNGLSWVGVSGDDGTFRGIYVDPDTNVVKKDLIFIERSNNKDFLRPEDLKEDEW